MSVCPVRTLPTTHIAPTLRPYCAHIAPTLRPHCAHIAPILRPHCAHIAPILRPYCAHIAPTSRPYCAHIAPTLRRSNFPRVRLCIPDRWSGLGLRRAFGAFSALKGRTSISARVCAEGAAVATALRRYQDVEWGPASFAWTHY